MNRRSMRTSAGAWSLALLLAAAVILVSPWRLVDPDELTSLAVGRFIVETGTVPRTDPFTFVDPGAAWSNPEWLSQLAFYSAHRVAGDAGLQALKLVLVALGWVLTLRLCRARGASWLLSAALLLLGLIGSPMRFTARATIHAFWLVPTYRLLLHHARRRPALLWALVPLGALWSNLHSSFVVGWVLLLAEIVEAAQSPRAENEGRPKLWPLAALLALHPLLPLLSPGGIHGYGQLIDHALGTSTYRGLILEWQPSSALASRAAQLPLHLLSLIGLLSFLPRPNRTRAGDLLVLLAGLALGYSSQRFLPLMVLLAVPPIAANLTRWTSASSPRVSTAAWASALCLAAVLLAPVAWGARTNGPTSLDERTDAPRAASQFLARQAPRGAHLFGPYNAGPWLLWNAGPTVKLYIDPRNNQGARSLRRYVQEVLPDPRRFEEEVRRLSIGLTLIDLGDGRMSALAQHLLRAPDWTLVFFDGRHCVYARRDPANQRLLREHGYGLLRGWLGFEHLLQTAETALPPPPAAILTDLTRLGEQSPALAEVARAYLVLSQDGHPPPSLRSRIGRDQLEQARRLLLDGLPSLPPSPELFTYLATAWARLGNERATAQVLTAARQGFPGAALPLGLELELARVRGDSGACERLTRELRRRAPPQLILWPILEGRTIRIP